MNFDTTWSIRAQMTGISSVVGDLKRIEKCLKDIEGTHKIVVAAQVDKIAADAVFPKGAQQQILGRIGSLKTGFLAVKGAVAGVAGVVAALGIAKIGKEFYDVGKGIMDATESMKMLRLGFQGVFGDEAHAKMGRLLDASMDLAGSLDEFATGALQIKAMGGLYGIDIENMREGKTLLQDLVKLTAISPQRGFIGMLQPALQAVFADYWRSLRFAIGAGKEQIAEISGLSIEAMTGTSEQAVKARLEGLRAYMDSINDELLVSMSQMWTTAVSSTKTIWNLALEDIGDKSGMYRSFTDTLNEINAELIKFRKSPEWDALAKKIGEPWTGVAGKVSEMLAQVKTDIKHGKQIDEIVGAMGEQLGPAIEDLATPLAGAAFELGYQLGTPAADGLIKGVKAAAIRFPIKLALNIAGVEYDKRKMDMMIRMASDMGGIVPIPTPNDPGLVHHIGDLAKPHPTMVNEAMKYARWAHSPHGASYDWGKEMDAEAAAEEKALKDAAEKVGKLGPMGAAEAAGYKRVPDAAPLGGMPGTFFEEMEKERQAAAAQQLAALTQQDAAVQQQTAADTSLKAAEINRETSTGTGTATSQTGAASPAMAAAAAAMKPPTGDELLKMGKGMSTADYLGFESDLRGYLREYRARQAVAAAKEKEAELTHRMNEVKEREIEECEMTQMAMQDLRDRMQRSNLRERGYAIGSAWAGETFMDGLLKAPPS